jgi:endonuclease/exonuclease/phosphatase (EEP) superfamily protein YafD
MMCSLDKESRTMTALPTALTTPPPEHSRRPSLLKGVFNVFIRAMVGAYGMSVTGFMLLRLVLGEVSILAYMTAILHLMLIPAVILLPLMLLWRKWLPSLMLLVPVGVFLVNYGPQFLPRSTAAAAAGDSAELTVLSYNIHAQNRNFEQIISLIAQADADVVALQEYSRTADTVLPEALLTEYPYQARHASTQVWSDGTESYDGQAVFSRYPITADAFWTIGLGHQRVEINWNDQTIALYNLHPIHIFSTRSIRAQEVDDIVRRSQAETLPHLLVGDFNMTDLSADYARITAGYGDAYRAMGWGLGWTFPDGQGVRQVQQLVPLARIDYLFYDEHWQTLRTAVLPSSGGSDHRPVLATFRWVGGMQ